MIEGYGQALANQDDASAKRPKSVFIRIVFTAVWPQGWDAPIALCTVETFASAKAERVVVGGGRTMVGVVEMYSPAMH